MNDKFILIALLSVFLCSGNVFSQSKYTYNQEGYYPSAKKIITVKTQKPLSYKIISEDTQKEVLQGEVDNVGTWKYSNESYGTIDVSTLSEEGTYKVFIEELGYSEPFIVSKNAGDATLKSSIEAFYLIRCSSPIEEQYAGEFARAAGHLDTEILIHPSALREGQDPNSKISSPRGWYDAGDYNKYIVNSGISTYSMLLAYAQYGTTLDKVEYKIPHESKALPLYLDNVKWNLDWMVTMQDKVDGGVYHKLTNANFDGITMPDQGQNTPRYVIQKTTAAALDFAAVMAYASRVYQPFDSKLATEYKEAAISAFEWAKKNPSVIYDQNELNNKYEPKVNTGAYDDKHLDDEFNWAATELYLLTYKKEYLETIDLSKGDYTQVQSWGNVAYLPLYSILQTDEKDLKKLKDLLPKAKEIVVSKADLLSKEYTSSVAKVSMGQLESDFVWGSNSVANNHAMLLLNAYLTTSNKDYIDASVGIYDYILGRNPLNISYLTGHGTHRAMHPHHRISEADKVEAPLPGLVIGGPQNDNNDPCEYDGDLPATKYSDTWCSYSTNEIAINWNASFVYMMSGLNAYYAKENVVK